MNQFERKSQHSNVNESITVDLNETRIIGNTNNCKFKLKQNRKLRVQKDLKRIRFLGKNKNWNSRFEEETLEEMPPKAPENRTQILSRNRNYDGMFNLHENEIYSKVLKRYFKIDKKGSDSKQKFCSSSTFINNSNGHLTSSKNKYPSSNRDKISNGINININNNNNLNSKVNKNVRTSEYFRVESLGNFNNSGDYDETIFYEDNFLIGSTMKSIVANITKTKNKILSNSLNLDGNQSNSNNLLEIEKNLVYAEGINSYFAKENSEDEEFLKGQNYKNMQFTISDFIPDLHLNVEDLESFYSSQESEMHSFYEEAFSQNINELNSKILENSTQASSFNNSPAVFRSPISSYENSEQLNFLFMKNDEETKTHKDKLHFFLLGNKNKRSFPEENIYEDKDRIDNNFQQNH